MRTSIKIAGLIVLFATLVSWEWWGRNHSRSVTRGELQSRAGSTVGAGVQENVKSALPSPISEHVAPARTPGVEPAAAIPERLQFILNGDGTKRITERLRSLHTINRNLMIEEAEELCRYLRSPAKDGANRAGENWLRNDMMDMLAEQPALPQGYPDVLIAIYEDPSQDIVMRDYALQHIPPVYDRANAQEKIDLQNTLWQATRETDSSIAGTSLLALLELTAADPAVHQGQVANTAFELAADDRIGELSRITAVQVCGRMNVGQALPVVEQLAQEAPTMPLRIAATAALGDYAVNAAPPQTADLSSFLARVAESSDPRQALAAESALRRITRSQTSLATGQNNKP